MTPLGQIIQLQTVSGKPITVGSATLTPTAQALIVRLPCGGFVWNRPAAVLVERDGQRQHIRILDVTRLLQLALLGLPLAFFLLVRATSSREKR
ncbi:MAG: hypothetical protein HYY04_14795 [Chloroflexi bacterium]|nr:hypothetical protein [Chloroflexota bacterium]